MPPRSTGQDHRQSHLLFSILSICPWSVAYCPRQNILFGSKVPEVESHFKLFLNITIMAITHTKRPLAQIPIVNYEKIRARDPLEIERLFDACQPPPVGQGTFFLDLRGPSTSVKTLMNLPAIDRGMMAYFKQSSTVKWADFRPDVERG